VNIFNMLVLNEFLNSTAKEVYNEVHRPHQETTQVTGRKVRQNIRNKQEISNKTQMNMKSKQKRNKKVLTLQIKQTSGEGTFPRLFPKKFIFFLFCHAINFKPQQFYKKNSISNSRILSLPLFVEEKP
jgi:hypothetical protein